MVEVADIFRAAGPAYREQFASRMLPSHLKAMRAIEECRTPALGGHLRQCTACGAYQYSYHSCLMGSNYYGESASESAIATAISRRCHSP